MGVQGSKSLQIVYFPDVNTPRWHILHIFFFFGLNSSLF